MAGNNSFKLACVLSLWPQQSLSTLLLSSSMSVAGFCCTFLAAGLESAIPSGGEWYLGATVWVLSTLLSLECHSLLLYQWISWGLCTHTCTRPRIHAFASIFKIHLYIRKAILPLQYFPMLPLQAITVGFILAFLLCVFIIPFSNSEKTGSPYPQYISIFNRSLHM